MLVGGGFTRVAKWEWEFRNRARVIFLGCRVTHFTVMKYHDRVFFCGFFRHF